MVGDAYTLWAEQLCTPIALNCVATHKRHKSYPLALVRLAYFCCVFIALQHTQLGGNLLYVFHARNNHKNVLMHDISIGKHSMN